MSWFASGLKSRMWTKLFDMVDRYESRKYFWSCAVVQIAGHLRVSSLSSAPRSCSRMRESVFREGHWMEAGKLVLSIVKSGI